MSDFHDTAFSSHLYSKTRKLVTMTTVNEKGSWEEEEDLREGQVHRAPTDDIT